MSGVSFSNVVWECRRPRSRRRLQRLAIPAGVALWAAAIVWLLVRVAT